MIQVFQDLDRTFFLFLNSFHSLWMNPIMIFFSGQVLWVPFVGYFFWYSYKQQGKNFFLMFGLFLLLTLIASDVTSSYILKNIVARLRPCRESDLLPLIYSFGQKCGGKYGFVSSHAANSIALVFFSLRTLSFKNKWINAIFIIPAIVGLSRIYLGVHYPGDILGGTVIGVFWAFVFSTMFNSSQGARRDNDQAPLSIS